MRVDPACAFYPGGAQAAQLCTRFKHMRTVQAEESQRRAAHLCHAVSKRMLHARRLLHKGQLHRTAHSRRCDAVELGLGPCALCGSLSTFATAVQRVVEVVAVTEWDGDAAPAMLFK
jgi:hypothetical protein